jgi:hypothetical protein
VVRGRRTKELVKRQEKGEGEYWLYKAMNLQSKQHLLQREDASCISRRKELRDSERRREGVDKKENDFSKPTLRYVS